MSPLSVHEVGDPVRVKVIAIDRERDRISLSTEHVADPADVLHVGDRVNVRIVGVEPERRRLSLSIRQTGR